MNKTAWKYNNLLRESNDKELTYVITYEVGNSRREKKVKAHSVDEAVNKAKVRNIIDIDIEEYSIAAMKADKDLLRDF